MNVYCVERQEIRLLRVHLYSVCFMYVHVHSVNVYAVVVFFHRLLSDSYPDEVKKTVDCLSANLTGVYDAHRITVVSFYSEVRQTVLWCEEFVLAYTSVFVLLDECYIYLAIYCKSIKCCVVVLRRKGTCQLVLSVYLRCVSKTVWYLIDYSVYSQ